MLDVNGPQRALAGNSVGGESLHSAVRPAIRSNRRNSQPRYDYPRRSHSH